MSESDKKPCEGRHQIVWTRGERARCRICGFDLSSLITLTDYDPLEEAQRKMMEDWSEPDIAIDADESGSTSSD